MKFLIVLAAVVAAALADIPILTPITNTYEVPRPIFDYGLPSIKNLAPLHHELPLSTLGKYEFVPNFVAPNPITRTIPPFIPGLTKLDYVPRVVEPLPFEPIVETPRLLPLPHSGYGIPTLDRADFVPHAQLPFETGTVVAGPAGTIAETRTCINC